MVTKSKIRRMIILAMLMLIVNTGALYAAWWTAKDIPVPPSAEEVKQQAKRIGGFDFKFTYYISSQDQKSIKDFYLRELPNLGWQERPIGEKLSDDAAAYKNRRSGDSIFFENNLVFEKDNVMLTVTFLPKGGPDDGKTKFSVSQGKLELKGGQPLSKKGYIPELLDKPKKNVVPTYPGATLANLLEKENYLRATYVTEGQIEDVASFYREHMPDYGWSLVNEIPVGKVDFNSAYKYAEEQSCPECSKKTLISKSATPEVWFMELAFSNAKKDNCKIGLFGNVIQVDSAKPALNFTNIRIEYEKNK